MQDHYAAGPRYWYVVGEVDAGDLRGARQDREVPTQRRRHTVDSALLLGDSQRLSQLVWNVVRRKGKDRCSRTPIQLSGRDSTDF